MGSQDGRAQVMICHLPLKYKSKLIEIDYVVVDIKVAVDFRIRVQVNRKKLHFRHMNIICAFLHFKDVRVRNVCFWL